MHKKPQMNFISNFNLIYIFGDFQNTKRFFCRAVDPHSSGRRRASSVGSRTADHLGAIGEDPAEDEEASDTETVTSLNTEGNRDGSNFLTRPYWLSDEGLKKGEVDVLSLQEEQFWKDLLEKYLYPIDEDKAEKVKRLAS